MPVNQEDVDAVKGLLWADEVPEMTAKQRRVGPGGSVINPTSIVATNKRVIIVNRATMGIRKDYEVIPYKQITSVRLERGIVASSVYIRVQGYDVDKGLLKNGKQEGEIDGMNNKDAKALADAINRHVEEETGEETAGPVQQDAAVGAYRFCSSCGTKNLAGSKFCSACGAKLE